MSGLCILESYRLLPCLDFVYWSPTGCFLVWTLYAEVLQAASLSGLCMLRSYRMLPCLDFVYWTSHMTCVSHGLCVGLSSNLFVNFVCVQACLHVSVLARKVACTSACLHMGLLACKLACRYACLHIGLPARGSACMEAYFCQVACMASCTYVYERVHLI